MTVLIAVAALFMQAENIPPAATGHLQLGQRAPSTTEHAASPSPRIPTAADERFERERETWDKEFGQWSQARESRMTDMLVGELSRDFPALPRLVRSVETRSESEAARENLPRLLDHARTDAPDRGPVLLLVADHLALSLGWQMAREEPDPAGVPDKRLLTLGGHEFVYEWAPLGGTWVYDRGLLRRVLAEYGETPWGDWAFLKLQERGWYTGATCPDDPAKFRAVIAESKKFLARRPSSPYRLDVMFDLAQAYEAWWSITRIAPGDPYLDYVNPADFFEGAEEARRQAIQLYAEIVRTGGASLFAAYAKLALPRLELSLDTNQRRFYCVYD